MIDVSSELSPRVISLARYLDRLPAGEYALVLVKPDLAACSWHVEITRVEKLREMELPQREQHFEQPSAEKAPPEWR